MRFHRHRWKTKKGVKVAVKRECRICGKKEINVWGHWLEAKSERSLELYALL